MKNRNFDFIIIGAGSAGCVLANELSADATCKVLILEAGPMDRNLFIHMPAGVYRVFRDPALNWNYFTSNEDGLCGRSIYTPRGRVVGGSSSINSMVYMRGHRLDYDGWAEEFNLPEWGFNNCLPYFIAGERYQGDATEWRGKTGRLGVKQANYPDPLYDAFLAAGLESGQGRSLDLNGANPEGLARLDCTVMNGKRCSAATAHLKPALTRSNLTLLHSAETQHVILNGNKAQGSSIYPSWGAHYCLCRKRSDPMRRSGQFAKAAYAIWHWTRTTSERMSHHASGSICLVSVSICRITPRSDYNLPQKNVFRFIQLTTPSIN